MAQQLWILRHGEAVPHDGADDAGRELTDHGRDQSQTAGRALFVLGVTVQMALTSPKVRARDTARLACAELGIEAIEHEPLRAGFDRDDALRLLGGAGDDQRILVVGHEPDLGQVVHDMTGARIDLKKGGIAAVRVHGTGGELIALLRPRELARIG